MSRGYLQLFYNPLIYKESIFSTVTILPHNLPDCGKIVSILTPVVVFAGILTFEIPKFPCKYLTNKDNVDVEHTSILKTKSP